MPTVLANPYFLDWRQFGQNLKPGDPNYLQRCRTSGAFIAWDWPMWLCFLCGKKIISVKPPLPSWVSPIIAISNTFNRFGESLFSRLASFWPKPEAPWSKLSTKVSHLWCFHFLDWSMWLCFLCGKKIISVKPPSPSWVSPLMVISNTSNRFGGSFFLDWRQFGQNPETCLILVTMG